MRRSKLLFLGWSTWAMANTIMFLCEIEFTP